MSCTIPLPDLTVYMINMAVSYKNQELLTLAVFFVVFVFSLCLVYPMLPVSTVCPFLSTASVISKVYFKIICNESVS